MDQQSRELLWVELSDLWLDTELSPSRLDAIADAVRVAGCSKEELRRIARFELAPVLGANLLAVAGEWSSFDPDVVVSRARRHQQKPSLWMRVGVALRLPGLTLPKELRQIEEIAFGSP